MTVRDPTERLLVSTRRRLALLTLGLLAALLVAMGVATVVVVTAQLDAATDAALRSTAQNALTGLEGQLPGADGGDSETATSDEPVGSSDTFVTVLDPSGHVVQNPRGIRLAGLPDRAALSHALAAGSDLRTVTAGGLPVRLLTLAIPSSDGAAAIGAVQAGLILTLHDRQASDLVGTVTLVGLVGLACAALLALLLTGRALVPIRAAFATERRFVAAASHELRTPAAIIHASGEVLQREALVRPEGAALVTGIVAEADRLSRLVAGLLALSVSRVDPSVVHLEPLDLAAIAVDAVARVAPLGAERGCTVAVAADPPPALPISGDADRLLQVMLVLLDNATRHSPHGSTVTVDMGRDRGFGWVSVGDRGPGVPAGDRERIFEPFVRAAGGRRERAEGTGLGLAVARTVAQRHGGTIVVGDEPGGGARFTVRIPLR
ncbi:MAG: sensor histidine kinase [Candidatus Limnocylindrales bacterium]